MPHKTLRNAKMCVILLRNTAIRFVFAEYFRFITYSRLFLRASRLSNEMCAKSVCNETSFDSLSDTFLTTLRISFTLSCITIKEFSREKK